MACRRRILPTARLARRRARWRTRSASWRASASSGRSRAKPGAAPERDWAAASYGAELYFNGATAADFSMARAAAASAWAG
eukprot:4458023-Pyramimonas_sp.AAC.1